MVLDVRAAGTAAAAVVHEKYVDRPMCACIVNMVFQYFPSLQHL